MDNILKPVTISSTEPNSSPKFIKTEQVNCIRDGKSFIWERIVSMDTVHVLVNKIDTEEILLVEQVRVPVLVNNPELNGIVTECCAGLIDKYPELPKYERADKIAIEEVHEELGYKVDNIYSIKTLRSSVGTSGNTMHCFYASVTAADFVGQQLEETEDIKVVAIPYAEIPYFLEHNSETDATTVMLLQWFLLNKDKGE